VAKSTQHVDKLGSYDDFKAPWESEAGADTEIDKPKLKRLIFNLKLDHAKSRDAGEDLKAEVAEKQTEVDTAKQEAADAAGGDAQKTIDKLTKERDEAVAKVTAFEERDAQAELRKEVLGDFAEKNPKAAKYVTGTTKEELEASLEEVKADWGITDDADGDEDGDEDEAPVVRNRPRTNLRNPADPAPGKPGEAEIDFDKVADQVISGGSVFR
jgi:hypothetical protein